MKFLVYTSFHVLTMCGLQYVRCRKWWAISYGKISSPYL